MSVFNVVGSATAVAMVVLALVVGARMLPWLVRVLPLGPARRITARRWLPAVQLAFVLAVVVFAAVLLLGQTPALVVSGVTALLVVGATWFAIRDVVAGVVLRAEHGFDAGCVLHADDIAGRVHRVGIRSLEIEGGDGRRVRVPYTRLRAIPLSMTRPAESGRALQFTTVLPRNSGGPDDMVHIRVAALNAAFASPWREPHVQLVAEDPESRTFVVTVYAADPSFLPFIEEAVADALACNA